MNDLDIVFENEDAIVVNKPSGLLVHKTEQNPQEETLADLIVKKYPQISNVGDDPARPGIVHRLDRKVSGLLVIAKNQEMFENLKSQFQNRTVEKEYLGLAYGSLPNDTGEITFKITRSKKTGRMVARPTSQEGRDAITRYDVIERFRTATFLKIKILTGRPHQIRLHFMALGHPIVGDNLYGRKLKNINEIKLDRIFLHAAKLSFDKLDGERVTVESPLPEELKAVLERLPKN